MNTWYGPVTSGGARSSSQLYALLYDYFTLRTYTSMQVLVAAPVPVYCSKQVGNPSEAPPTAWRSSSLSKTKHQAVHPKRHC